MCRAMLEIRSGDGRMDNDDRAAGAESQSGIIYTHQRIAFSIDVSVTVTWNDFWPVWYFC